MDRVKQLLMEMKSGRRSRDEVIEILSMPTQSSRGSAHESTPLLRCVESAGGTATFVAAFDGSESFLRDHLVQGQKVLPGVMYMELARAALFCRDSTDTQNRFVLALQNMVWLRPLVVSQAAELYIELHESPSGTTDFRMYSLSDATAVPERQLHAQGSAVRESRAALAPDRTSENSALRESSARRFEISDCYAAFQAAGIHYGPSHRGLTSVRATRSPDGRRHIFAEVRVPEVARGAASKFYLHPSLLDSALQALIAVPLGSDELAEIKVGGTRPILPFALDRLTIFDRTPTEARVYASFVPKKERDGTTRINKVDIEVCDTSGRVCLRLEGFTSRVLEDGIRQRSAPVRAVSRATESQISTACTLLIPAWEPVPFPVSAPWPTADCHLLVVGGSAAQQRAWLGLYPRGRAMTIASHESIESVARGLAAQGPLDHVVWCGPASVDVDEEQLLNGQEAGVLSLFRLIKGLLATGYGARALGLTIVTVQSQAVMPSEKVYPIHASVDGFVGSLAKEYLFWRIRSVDLAGERDDVQVLQQILRLPAEPNGDIRAFRDGAWHRRCFTALDKGVEGPSLLRNNGIYVVIGGAGVIGEVLTEHLIREYQAQVVWLGRRASNPEIDSKLERLGRLGPRPCYIRADATDRDALQLAYEKIKGMHGRIHGVVHAALWLLDMSLANMDDQRFRAGLAAKIDGSIRIAQVFAREPLDVFLFFSSMQSFSKMPGQSNYAAGCAFSDAFARWLASSKRMTTRVVNWGYWGATGVAVSDTYRAFLIRQGIEPIQPAEGMAALRQLMCGDHLQLGALKFATNQRAKRATDGSAPAVVQRLCANIEPDSSRISFTGHPEIARIERVLAGLLIRQMQTLGYLTAPRSSFDEIKRRADVVAPYGRWIEECIRLLAAAGHLSIDRQDVVLNATDLPSSAVLWSQWSTAVQEVSHRPDLAAQFALLDACIRALPDLLSGRRRATDVIFPNGSTERVEGIYRGNPVADWFNTALAELLVEYVRERYRNGTGGGLRILEVGAGIGSASRAALQALKPYQSSIDEYAFTDLSRFFLVQAERTYAKEFPCMRFSTFDVENPPEPQGVDTDAYDVVIASNVLHATRNIRQTLRNVKATLKNNGVLLINEITGQSLFSLVSFGLLDGWWRYEDEQLRQPGGPAIAKETWERVLSQEGFRQVVFPAHAAHQYGQQIIVAESDGIALHPAVGSTEQMRPPGKPEPVDPLPMPENVQGETVLSRIRAVITRAIAGQMRIDEDDVDPSAEFNEFGFDSISFTQFANWLNETYELELSPTVFFEYPTVAQFTEHLAAAFGDRFVTDPRTEKATASQVFQLAGELTREAAQLLRVRIDDIDVEAEFNEFGFDSLSLTAFTNQLNANYGLSISPAILFEYPTIRSLSEYFLSEHGAAFATKVSLMATGTAETVGLQKTISTLGKPVSTPRYELEERETRSSQASPPAGATSGEPIAIVGMSISVPGARDVEAFWKTLSAGEDCITEVPSSRWDWRQIYGDPAREENKTNIKWGGFIEGVDEFDALFFGISPREAQSIDPHQRLLLTHGWKAIEDAGYSAQALWGSKTGVFIGTMTSEYASLLAQTQSSIEGFSSTSVVSSLGPNRLSYLLNLHGPSEPIETACSSSLVAIHRAIRAIHGGDCEQALVGGVSTILTPWAHISFSKAGMLSQTGRCKTFSSEADGYVRGEGVGMLFLKELPAAERDGDHIYGVIRGSAENHGGRANSLTAPNPKAQADLIETAYRRAKIDPRRITYIETHGTGTALGDPIEINGLKSAFEKLYQDRNLGVGPLREAHCALGSVKTNIGHLEMAAGVASIVKVLLQLKHRTLVASLHCRELNPYIDLKGSPFHVIRERRPWESSQAADGAELPRVAGVSSFGFGGVNAHVIIEEYRPDKAVSRAKEIAAAGPAIIVLSAKTDARLQEQAQQLLQHLHTHDYEPADLMNVAYTLQAGRDAMEHRLGFMAGSFEELRIKLSACLSGGQGEFMDLHRGEVKRVKETLASMGGDEESASLVRAWIEKGEFVKVLEMWTRGWPIAWERLYSGGKPCRVSLPTYPFARDRYWANKGPSEVELHRDDVLRNDALSSVATHRNVEGSNVRPIPEVRPHEIEMLTNVERLAARTLLQQLHVLGLFSRQTGVADWCETVRLPQHYRRWLEESIRILTAHRLVFRDGDRCAIVDEAAMKSSSIWTEWERQSGASVSAPAAPPMNLLKEMLFALPKILTGQQLATDILFAASSMQKVEAVYKGNAVADYFNAVLADAVGDFVCARLEREPTEQLKILEIGAGTGSTTEAVLTKLQPHRSDIAEYCFTDVSRAFLLESQRKTGDSIPYLRHRLVDVERGMEAQGIERGAYDIVVASNVFHATKNIRETLRNARGALRRNGMLVLNETTVKTVFAHLTFGMLQGWWRYEDEDSRITGSPLLSVEGWKNVLAAEGFTSISFPAAVAESFGQQIIVAYSDGALHSRESVTSHSPVLLHPTATPAPSGDVVHTRQVGMQQYVQEIVLEELSKSLGIDRDAIDVHSPFREYGLDSIMGVRTADSINERLSTKLSTSSLFENSNVKELSAHIVACYGEKISTRKGAFSNTAEAREIPVSPASAQQESRLNREPADAAASTSATAVLQREPIAIIGIGGRFPGADNIDELWKHLQAGTDCITTVPSGRWDHSRYFETRVGHPDKSQCNWGGFVRGVDEFDAEFFEISAPEADVMGPQERLLLEVAWEAAENAGYHPELFQSLHRGRVGVYVGARTDFEAGLNAAMAAARISALLQVSGPSLVVDTHSASSASALNLACEALAAGMCEAAIVGGVFVLAPEHFVIGSMSGTLATSSRSRSFADGDGILYGESAVVAVLKPLSSAERDNDRILALIRATAANCSNGGFVSDSKLRNPTFQQDVVREALQKARVPARTITCIDSAANGKPNWDAVEFHTLKSVFQEQTEERQFCALGSVKSNIGHSGPASALTQLTKLVLQLRHRRLVPSIGVDRENPLIAFADSPFYLSRESVVWEQPETTSDGETTPCPRRALLTSNGAGGSNVCAVLEEYIPGGLSVVDTGNERDRREYLILLSARTLKQLWTRMHDLKNHLMQTNEVSIADLAYTLRRRRRSMNHRFAVVVPNVKRLCERIDQLIEPAALQAPNSAEMSSSYYGSASECRREVSALIDSDDENHLLRKYASEGNLQKLAFYWTRGSALPNAVLDDTFGGRLISTPSYPFERVSVARAEAAGGMAEIYANTRRRTAV